MAGGKGGGGGAGGRQPGSEDGLAGNASCLRIDAQAPREHAECGPGVRRRDARRAKDGPRLEGSRQEACEVARPDAAQQEHARQKVCLRLPVAGAEDVQEQRGHRTARGAGDGQEPERVVA